MIILGISAYFHDSAAALIKDGVLIAAAEEERFIREKHTRALPISAARYCLKTAHITIDSVDYLVFYQIPYLLFVKRLAFFLTTLPWQFNALRENPRFIHEGFFMRKSLTVGSDLYKKLGGTKNQPSFKQINVEHHLAHAASAFYPSPFKNAAILSIDGCGEITSTLLAHTSNGKITKIKHIEYPDSLGLFYSAGTQFLGFKRFYDEAKVMGLSSYGRNVFKKEFDDMLTSDSNGSFIVNREWFDYWRGNYRFYSHKWIDSFGLPRKPEDLISQTHKNIAASMQRKTEEVGVSLAKYLRKITHEDALCCAGGVALNSLMNSQILKKSSFRKIFIQPAANDAGAALGAALFAWNKVTLPSPVLLPSNIYLGPSFSNKEVLHVLAKHKEKILYKKIQNMVNVIARDVTEGKIVAWFQGRMEFGPRALGARSIVVDPRKAKMKDILNLKVKHRESFRPFAPSILLEDLSSWYEATHASPYMNLVYKVRAEKRKIIPAPTHVDGTGRVQTVTKSENGIWYDLILEFKKLTGVPLVLNTSFNIGGEPIVATPEDAIRSFLSSPIDVLAIEDYYVTKLPQLRNLRDPESSSG